MPPLFVLFQNAVGLCGFIDSPLPEKFFLKVFSENFLLFYSSSARILLDLWACSSSISLLLQDGVYLWQESNIYLAVSALKKWNLVVINSWNFFVIFPSITLTMVNGNWINLFFSISFFRDCKTVESGSGHHLLDVYKLWQLPAKIG